ncbi:MAG: hypothetical protein AAGU21_01510 [Solidesulfovibrio sp.]|uniref:hypothetical protein n=1 Tax=Solidesulfovibrio sp. TaxID=2910990 RepID=UPI002B1F0DCA|nr:hypothetical protein [Solidesulfovibrio sp.]MEA4857835.1 hypothetical protein [Solidesulfovibrio sp.]
MRAARLVVFLLLLGCLPLFGCARHTYYVELANGKYFYADPPLVLDNDKGVYRMWVAGQLHIIPLDDVRYLDDAAQICYKNGVTDTFTCYDALYQF